MNHASRIVRNTILRGTLMIAPMLLAACGGGGSGTAPVSPTKPTEASVSISTDAQGSAPPSHVVATYSTAIGGVQPGFFSAGGTCTQPPVASTQLDATNTVATVQLSGGQCDAGQTLTLTLDPSRVSLNGVSLSNASVWTHSYTIVPAPQPISGSVSGLTGTVVLTSGTGQSLTISTDGAFSFPDAVDMGSAYAVSVTTQPANQICSVSNGSGTIGALPVTGVAVTCAAHAYTVGGQVAGLGSGDSVTLKNNGGDPVTVSANGGFSFAALVAQGAAYSVSVASTPTGQTCTVSNGSGTMGASNVSNVQVNCATTSYTVGGTVSGLNGGGSVSLQNNGGDTLTLGANGAFSFATPTAQGGGYAVTVLAQPAGQICTVSNGSGSAISANVSNVQVNCQNSTTLQVMNAPLIVAVNNGASTLTVKNTGSSTAYNVHAEIIDLNWTAVTTQPAPGCASLALGASCDLSFDSSDPYVVGAIVIRSDNTLPVPVTTVFSIKGYLVFEVMLPGMAKVVDTADMGPYPWPNGSTTWGPDPEQDGPGNTLRLMDALHPLGTAVDACANKPAESGIAYWYLPAINELSVPDPTVQRDGSIQQNLAALLLGDFVHPDTGYWSSTEATGTTAFVNHLAPPRFPNVPGTSYAASKTDLRYVRCVGAARNW